MAEHFGAEVKRRIENAALLGGYLDTARQDFGALPPAPGVLQERRKPGSVAEYQTRRLGMKQNIAGLESQYAEAVGSPTNALVSPGVVPALQSTEIDRQPGFGAVPPVETEAATPVVPPSFAPPGSLATTQPFGQPMSTRPAAVIPAVEADRGGFQPIQSQDTYDEQGNLVHRAITGSGAPVGYGAREPIVVSDLTGIGGLIGMKQAASANTLATRRGIAQATLEQNAALKGPGAAKSEMQIALAMKMLDPNTTPEEQDRLGAISAALEGRVGAGMRPSIPPNLQPLTPDPKNPTGVEYDPRTRTLRSLPIQPVARTMTYTEVVAQAKEKGETPAQGLARAKKMGVTVTGAP